MPSVLSFLLTHDVPNESGTFSEGDMLTGKVTLVLLKEVSVQSLYVKAKGDAEVRWSKKTGDKTRTYSASKRYFKLKQLLLEDQGSKETVIPKGTHVYNFRFKLPENSMPSSFRGSHGKIVYMLEAVMSRSWRLDSTASNELKFVSKAFPGIHSLMTPQVGSVNKAMGLFSSGHVHMSVSMDKRAYAPGETMVIVAQVNNNTSSDMTPKFSFKQNVVYRASGSTNLESHTIHKTAGNCIKAQTQTEARCAISVPPGQFQTIQNCEILTVEYYVKVYLDISFAFDPEVMLPVVILPLNFTHGRQPDVTARPYQACAPGGPSTSDFPPPAVPSGPYPASPNSGGYGYPGAQRYSVPQPAFSDTPPMYAFQSHPAQPPPLSGGYSNPVPQPPAPYGTPFSSSSSSPMLHPPPTAPAFHPPPSAPAVDPAPSSSFNISPSAPAFNSLSSASMMNVDFLAQSDEPPPAYSLLFPSSAPENSDAK